MSSLRTAFVLSLSAVVFGGCPGPNDPPPPPPSDDGGTIDLLDAGEPFIDTDGDGLCDGTELAWGTDPLMVDSDSDGLTDRAERDFGYAPLLPDSPPRDELVFMEEVADATAQLGLPIVVRGEGETYTGVFQALPIANRLDYDASTFLEGARAVGADPMDNVFEVQEEAGVFRGVFGRPQLIYEVRFAFGGNTPRNCVTAFPFRHQVKREDGVTVGFGRYLLVLLPDNQRLANAEWCVPDGGCI